MHNYILTPAELSINKKYRIFARRLSEAGHVLPANLIFSVSFRPGFMRVEFSADDADVLQASSSLESQYVWGRV